MLSYPSFRPATVSDASDLAVLFDAASRRLISWVWGLEAKQGQSWFEVGRNVIRNNAASGGHFTNWQVAILDHQVAGGFCGFRIADPYDAGDLTQVPPAIIPFIELAEVGKGTYYVSIACVYPEHRGKGVGTAMLDKAADLARAAKVRQMSLIVETFNPDAKRLYDRYGFRELARRRFIRFPGCEDEGDLVLMVKDLTA